MKILESIFSFRKSSIQFRHELRSFSDSPKGKGSFRFNFFCKISFILILGWIIFHKPILRKYGLWLSPSDENPRADVAVVMGRNISGLETAIDLLKSREVKAIYLSTFSRKRFDSIIDDYGLPKNEVYWGGCKTSTTYAEPFFFVQAYENYELSQYKSIVIVTSPYHLRRAFWSFDHVTTRKGLDLDIKTYAASDDKLRKRLDWWQYSYARNWVSHETQKNIFYWVYYGLLNRPNTDIEFNSFFNKEETALKSRDFEKECDENSNGLETPEVIPKQQL